MLMARNADTLEKTAEDIRKETGVTVVAARADITSTEQVDAAAKTAKDAFGTVHIVVNNAGGPMRRMDRQILWPDSDWIGDLDNKILGALAGDAGFPPAHAGRRHGPHHQHQRHGIDDRVGAGADARAEQRGDESGDRIPGDRSRQSADHGQHRGARDWSAPRGVTCGRRTWPSSRTSARTNSSPSFCKRMGILAGRWAGMDEVADTVVFLASDRARYYNGAKIILDGGLNVNVRPA